MKWKEALSYPERSARKRALKVTIKACFQCMQVDRMDVNRHLMRSHDFSRDRSPASERQRWVECFSQCPTGLARETARPDRFACKRAVKAAVIEEYDGERANFSQRLSDPTCTPSFRLQAIAEGAGYDFESGSLTDAQACW